MTDLAAWLEATALAQHLKAARWTYPLVNAGHIFGIALLVGAIVPMDVAILRGRHEAIVLLRPWAIAGLLIAVVFGGLLFITQAGDYIDSRWFLAKISVVALALANAALGLLGTATRRAAAVSLLLWPTVLILGRMVGYQ